MITSDVASCGRRVAGSCIDPSTELQLRCRTAMSSTTETDAFGRTVTIEEAVAYYHDLLDVPTWFDADISEVEYLEAFVVDLSSQVDRITESYRPFAPPEEEAVVPLEAFDAAILRGADQLATYNDELQPLGVPQYEKVLEVITQLHDEHGYPSDAHRPDTSATPPSW